MSRLKYLFHDKFPLLLTNNSYLKIMHALIKYQKLNIWVWYTRVQMPTPLEFHLRLWIWLVSMSLTMGTIFSPIDTSIFKWMVEIFSYCLFSFLCVFYQFIFLSPLNFPFPLYARQDSPFSTSLLHLLQLMSRHL